LNADRLADAIRESVDSDSISKKAADLGRLLRHENGIATAVEFIERTVASDNRR
jgi:UDP:flavonoid glycosyltransferase YjiC (YdhE family)